MENQEQTNTPVPESTPETVETPQAPQPVAAPQEAPVAGQLEVFNFPHLGKSVKASSMEEALKLVTNSKE